MTSTFIPTFHDEISKKKVNNGGGSNFPMKGKQMKGKGFRGGLENRPVKSTVFRETTRNNSNSNISSSSKGKIGFKSRNIAQVKKSSSTSLKPRSKIDDIEFVHKSKHPDPLPCNDFDDFDVKAMMRPKKSTTLNRQRLGTRRGLKNTSTRQNTMDNTKLNKKLLTQKNKKIITKRKTKTTSLASKSDLENNFLNSEKMFDSILDENIDKNNWNKMEEIDVQPESFDDFNSENELSF